MVHVQSYMHYIYRRNKYHFRETKQHYAAICRRHTTEQLQPLSRMRLPSIALRHIVVNQSAKQTYARLSRKQVLLTDFLIIPRSTSLRQPLDIQKKKTGERATATKPIRASTSSSSPTCRPSPSTSSALSRHRGRTSSDPWRTCSPKKHTCMEHESVRVYNNVVHFNE